MSTVFTHAALPWLVSRGQERPRREVWLGMAVACIADLDVVGAAFDIRPESLFGHRGATHSLLAAALFATLAWLFTRRDRAAFLWLLGCALSHPLVDLLSEFESGVALFAPWAERFSAPVRPVPALPLGLDELLGRWGFFVLLNEALLVVLPVWIATRWSRSTSRVTWARIGAAWLFGALVLHQLAPGVIAPRRVRVMEPPADVPTTPMAGVPGDTWVTDVRELERLGLFGTRLEPARIPWSSGFFPSWFGREAGRWKDPRLTLIGRTFFGTRPPTPEEAAQQLDRLSPIEKYDVATGDLSFAATRESLSTSHNARPWPRFWHGLCNGVSAAAMERPEPVRTVTVTAPDGREVHFEPLDVKALLALAYYFPASDVELGESCDVVAFDAPRFCAMSPALLLLATANVLGRAHQSFQLDVHATQQAQYYAVAGATLRIDERRDERWLVTFDFDLSSTTLPPDPSAPIGLRPVHFTWVAELEVDGAGHIVNGRWLADGPDSLVFPSGGPELLDGGVLTVNPGVRWDFIDRLATQSAK